jgi:acetyl esterase/lipase
MLNLRHPVRHLASLAVALAALGPAAGRATTPQPPTEATPVLDDRYPERRIAFPGQVTGLADLTYAAPVGYRPLKLDLYLPRHGARPAPLVLFIHGGGFSAGHSRHSGAFADWPAVLASIAARGYVVGSVNYRLSGEAPFPAAEQDVKAAIRWIRSNATRYGVDPNRAVVFGGSAGGQLAGLTAVSCGVAAFEPTAPQQGGAPTVSPAVSDCVQGAVTWYGVFDMTRLPAPAGLTALGQFVCGAATCPEATVRAASPITYVSHSSPPMLLIHGSADRTVPTDQSVEMHRALTAAGVQAKLVIIPGVDHSFIGPTPAVTRKASLEALAETLAFIDGVLKKAQP